MTLTLADVLTMADPNRSEVKIAWLENALARVALS